MIVAVYVDDILLATKDRVKMDEVKRALSAQFEVKDLGDLHYLLGVSVIQNPKQQSIWIGQPTYTNNVLKKFGMEDAKSIATPVNIGSKLVKATENDELV